MTTELLRDKVFARTFRLMARGDAVLRPHPRTLRPRPRNDEARMDARWNDLLNAAKDKEDMR